ncbi:enoyl-CoA hydratase/isomerase family protein [Acidiphilium sp.]|uniref:enoyl-CoA hydratase/isomerase family protein n=1 Tax=Acidiphilium sp. TaxID=527 RepID=UPI003CFD9D3B
MSDADVLIRVVGRWGHITLNRPRALNALSYAMCCAIDDALVAWAGDAAILGVLIDGAGERGFCAGGDIRALYAAVRGGDAALADGFFAREYQLNARIATYPKPYIALMDGITMGGGIGLSAHGSHRVVTERSVLAMPEVGIGFIPDIGATHLLGRVADGLGTHVALTAMRLGAADALAIDLADHYVAAARLEELRRLVLGASSVAAAEAGIASCAAAAGASALMAARDWIGACYRYETVAEILGALEAAGPAGRAAAAVILAQSPTSVMLTLRALHDARGYAALKPCLQQEYRVAVRCIRGHDFMEGVRAAVVDKDRTPHWRPDRLAAVDAAAIAAHFLSLGAAELRFD